MVYVVDGAYSVRFSSVTLPGPADAPCYTRYFGRHAPCVTCRLTEALAARRATVWRDPTGAEVSATPVGGSATDGVAVLRWDSHVARWLPQMVRLSAVGRLVPGFAHEASNPLTVIRTGAELLMAHEAAQVDRELLDLLGGASDRLAEAIRGLRLADSDTIEDGSLAAALRRAVTLTAITLQRHGIALRQQIEVTGSVPTVDVDWVVAMVVHLILAADEVLRHHVGERAIRLHAHPLSADQAAIVVWDNRNPSAVSTPVDDFTRTLVERAVSHAGGELSAYGRLRDGHIVELTLPLA